MDEELLLAFLRKQAERPKLYRDTKFKAQDAFVTDTSRFVAAQCSRRAGKTNGLALRFLRALETHPGALCVYIALTRESARNIMWPVMQEQDEIFKAGLTFTESNLTITHPNGARLQLFGADMQNFIRRLKGIKTPAAAIDESQDHGAHLQSLIDDVLTPTLTDYHDSWLALTGTPGPIPSGYFYEVTAQKKYGYSTHYWTLLDNPYLPDASKFLEEIKRKREWDENNPTLRREWLNQWVLDLESLLIKYHKERNDYSVLPPAGYTYILGIDIGLKDADALAVLAWSEASPNIYLVEEVITADQDISSLVAGIRQLAQKYDISKMVMDAGGLGAKIAEELRRRHHLPIEAADKTRKMENAALLNEYLRTGRFKAKSGSRFVQDSYRVQIDWERSTPDRIVVRDNYHSDIIDAVLYAFKLSPAYTYQEARVKPKWGTPEWAAEETVEMERQAVEHFTKQAEIETTEWEW